jgi:hypothetical protein
MPCNGELALDPLTISWLGLASPLACLEPVPERNAAPRPSPIGGGSRWPSAGFIEVAPMPSTRLVFDAASRSSSNRW